MVDDGSQLYFRSFGCVPVLPHVIKVFEWAWKRSQCKDCVAEMGLLASKTGQARIHTPPKQRKNLTYLFGRWNYLPVLYKVQAKGNQVVSDEFVILVFHLGGQFHVNSLCSWINENLKFGLRLDSNVPQLQCHCSDQVATSAVSWKQWRKKTFLTGCPRNFCLKPFSILTSIGFRVPVARFFAPSFVWYPALEHPRRSCVHQRTKLVCKTVNKQRYKQRQAYQREQFELHLCRSLWRSASDVTLLQNSLVMALDNCSLGPTCTWNWVSASFVLYCGEDQTQQRQTC